MIDISPVISARLAVWPGDVSFQRELSMDLQQGDGFSLSSIRTTVHLGAHVDAPNHYSKGAEGIHTRNLELYFGPCQVIRLELPRGERILPQHLADSISAPRVLFRTGSFPNPESWSTDFNALSVELIHYLQQQGVQLVGIDTPSIDLFDDKDLQAHQAVAQHNMAILEGIVLDQVAGTHYTLCALPLRLEHADASPVRAVLLEF